MPSKCRLKRVRDSPTHDVTLDTAISDWSTKAVKMAKPPNDSPQGIVRSMRTLCGVLGGFFVGWGVWLW